MFKEYGPYCYRIRNHERAQRLSRALLLPEFSNIFLQPGKEVKGVSVTMTFFLYKCEIHLD